MHTMRHAISKSFCLLLGWVITAGAQAAPDSARRSNWAGAFTIGLPGVGAETSPLLGTIGLQFTQVNPGRISADVAIGTLPWGLANGALVLGMRAGVVLPMQAASDLFLLPSAGLSAIGYAAPAAGGESGAIYGFNTGFGILSGTPDSGGVRFNVTWHRFGDEIEESLWLAEVGFVFKGGSRTRPRSR